MKVISIDEIKDFNEGIYNIINNIDLNNLQLGKHYFKNNIFCNVEIYTTKPRHQYESHKKYIDIQIVLKGKERIIVDTLENVETKILYSSDNDIAFYYDNNKGMEYLLNEKECLILYPEDAHMPCVSVDENIEVKKVVFKIPLSITKDIKCLAMDVDGTLTDGKIYMGNDDESFKAFNIQDGYGIANKLKKNQITPVIITGRHSKIVENRCKELGIVHVYQNVKDKESVLKEVCSKLNIGLENVAYIGDDENDSPCINLINQYKGITACPKNAHSSIQDKVNYIANSKGGKGAVRDLIDWILNEE